MDPSADGVNSGENGGRVCWAISGTLCEMDLEETVGSKISSCLNCDFFYQVLEEEKVVKVIRMWTHYE